MRERHKPAKATITFILVTVILDVTALGIIIPVFPRLVEDFVTSTANASLFNSLFITIWSGMQFLASPFLGSLSDRFGRRPIILISTFGLAVDYILIAIAPTLWWLFIARALSGLTSASIATVYAYMADITLEEQRAKAFGLIGAAFSLGFIIGPLVGGLLGELGPRAPFWTAAFLSCLAFLYGIFVLPESLSPHNRMAFSWQRANPLGALQLLISQRKLFILAIINFISNFCNYIFHSVFVLYTAHRFGFTSLHIGAILTLSAILNIVVQVGLVGVCVKHFKYEGTLALGLVVGATGTLIMALAPSPIILVLAFFPQALWGLAIPTLQTLMTTYIKKNQQGQLQGANMSLAALAGIVAPMIFGSIYALFISKLSFLNLPGAPFLLAGFLLLFAASLAWKKIR